MSESRLEQQRNYIENKLVKSKMFNKYGLTLVDNNDVIINSLMGELRNAIQAFFQGDIYKIKKCEHCQTTSARQFERAHTYGMKRADVALNALIRIRPDESLPIKQRDFIKAFIEEHKYVPLWILCNTCHTKYDNS